MSLISDERLRAMARLVGADQAFEGQAEMARELLAFRDRVSGLASGAASEAAYLRDIGRAYQATAIDRQDRIERLRAVARAVVSADGSCLLCHALPAEADAPESQCPVGALLPGDLE